MRKNLSPWLHQLDATRAPKYLTHDVATNVAIIGAGIAGIATAYFTLKYTTKHVTLLERFKLAHGATGHNAGQIVSYFERGFASMVEEFGVERARAGQKAIDDAWELLDEMYSDASLDIPFSRFMGHAGLTSMEQILWHLKNNHARRLAGLHFAIIRIADVVGSEAIPADYTGLYTMQPHEDVLRTLETDAKEYIAVVSTQKGCINSALFCQEVLLFLLKKYPNRFGFYEHAPVHKILLREDHAILDVEKHVITADHIALCTNGFENVHIVTENGLDVDAKYHHLVSGKVGYMSGYLETMNKLPIAISYYNDPVPGMDNSYFYLTRRPYEYEKGTHHNLISIGGPDMDIEEHAAYSFDDSFPDEMAGDIDAFVRHTYHLDPNRKIDYIFTWHGLMGYTRNGIRLIGPEPTQPALLYNLGCNGIGILPSLYGGKKLSRHLAGEIVEPSVFDVPRVLTGEATAVLSEEATR